MTHERRKGSEEPTITGHYVDIYLGDLDELGIALTDRTSETRILSIEDQDALPYPVTSVDLESAWWTSHQRLPNLYASLIFRPTAHENSPGNWPDGFLADLKTHLQQYEIGPVAELEHDPLSLYVSLDSEYAVRISLEATHSDNGIGIDLVPCSEIKEGTHVSLEAEELEEATAEYALLHITTILGISLDTLHATLGNPVKKRAPRYLLSSAMQPKTPAEADNPRAAVSAKFGSQALVVAGQAPETMSPSGEAHDDPRLSFLDLGGLNGPIQRLQAIGDVFLGGDLSARYGLQPQPFVLYGPPGTGKTSLVEALGTHCDTDVQKIKSTDIITKWLGEAAQKLDDIFLQAYQSEERVILFFDEIDTFLSVNRSNDSSFAQMRGVLTHHLGSELAKHPNVLFVGATNKNAPDLDEAATRSGRIEMIPVPLPTKAERIDIWAVSLASRRRQLSLGEDGPEITDDNNPISDPLSFDYDLLSERSADMSGADINAIITNALMASLQKHIATGHEQHVLMDDLVEAITRFRVN